MNRPDARRHRIEITESDLHPHLRARMQQRGVTSHEIGATLNHGWEAPDAKVGTNGKVFVFPYHAEWEGEYFEEKEVTVYYRTVGNSVLLLTVKARYGKGFAKRVSTNED